MDAAALQRVIHDKFSAGLFNAKVITDLSRNLRPKWQRGISVPADEIRCWLEQSQQILSDLRTSAVTSKAQLEAEILQRTRKAHFNAAVICAVAVNLGPKWRDGIIGAAQEIQHAVDVIEKTLSDVC